MGDNQEKIFIETKVMVDETFYGQREQLCAFREKYIQQIEKQLNTLTTIFDWINQDLYYQLKRTIIEMWKVLEAKNLKTKYVTAACFYNVIKSMTNIRQDHCNQQLITVFNLKQRKLLSYLRQIEEEKQKSELTSTPHKQETIIENIDPAKLDLDKLCEQIPHFHEKLRKYFYGAGQTILITLKKDKSQTYTEVINQLLSHNKHLLIRLFQLQIVKQFCLSKRPSRLIINLGYFALQVQRVNILYGDYSRLFTISINSLRYFTKGLLSIFYDFLAKITYTESYIKIEKSAILSQTYVEHIDYDDKKHIEESNLSQEFSNDTDMMQRQISVVRNYMEDFEFLFIDTGEEDDLFEEFDLIMSKQTICAQQKLEQFQ